MYSNHKPPKARWTDILKMREAIALTGHILPVAGSWHVTPCSQEMLTFCCPVFWATVGSVSKVTRLRTVCVVSVHRLHNVSLSYFPYFEKWERNAYEIALLSVRASVCVCTSLQIFELALMSAYLCLPLMFSFSVRSVSYQMKLGN
jgi:hypothetical protein